MSTTHSQSTRTRWILPDPVEVDVWHLASVRTTGGFDSTTHSMDYHRIPAVVEGRPEMGTRVVESSCGACGTPLKFRLYSQRLLDRSLLVCAIGGITTFIGGIVLMAQPGVSFSAMDSYEQVIFIVGAIFFALGGALLTTLYPLLVVKYRQNGVTFRAKHVQTGAKGRGSANIQAHRWSMRGSSRAF